MSDPDKSKKRKIQPKISCFITKKQKPESTTSQANINDDKCEGTQPKNQDEPQLDVQIDTTSQTIGNEDMSSGNEQLEDNPNQDVEEPILIESEPSKLKDVIENSNSIITVVDDEVTLTEVPDFAPVNENTKEKPVIEVDVIENSNSTTVYDDDITEVPDCAPVNENTKDNPTTASDAKSEIDPALYKDIKAVMDFRGVTLASDLSADDLSNIITNNKLPDNKVDFKNSKNYKKFDPYEIKKLGKKTQHLHFSRETQKLYCLSCTFYHVNHKGSSKLRGEINPKSNNWICNGFDNWRRFKDKSKGMEHHVNNAYHVHSDSFLKDFQIKKAGAGKLEEAYDKFSDTNKVNNTKALLAVTKAVQYLGGQGLAFRGHDEHLSTDSNPGNFLSLLQLIASYEPALKDKLDEKIQSEISTKEGDKSRPRSSLTSARIQNEFVSLISQKLLEDIVKEIKARE